MCDLRNLEFQTRKTKRSEFLDNHNALVVPAIVVFDKYFADCCPYTLSGPSLGCRKCRSLRRRGMFGGAELEREREGKSEREGKREREMER